MEGFTTMVSSKSPSSKEIVARTVVFAPKAEGAFKEKDLDGGKF